MFRNLFLILAPGTTPTDRVERVDDLSTTVMVPVPDAQTAVAVAKEAEYDLIELYGGLGMETAAAILKAAPNTPVGFTGGADTPTAATATAVLYEDPDADPAVDRWTFGATTVVAIPSPSHASEVAATLVAAGAQRVELCGGMGPIPAAAVQAKVPVPVTTVLFGFESLPAAAAYLANVEAATTQTPARDHNNPS